MQISEGIKHQLLKILRQNNLMTVATLAENDQPSAAIVEFLAEDDLSVVFATNRRFRKYKNLKAHPLVALTVGSYEDVVIQYEGVAVELNNEEKRPYTNKLASRMRINYYPVAPRDDYAFFRISPKWIHYADVDETPWDEFSVTFDESKTEAKSV